jgi:organic radical activating enzyme
MKARISEVFASIQGEGLYFGEKQLFVRFYGCNLSCQYCDTRIDRYMEYEPQELVDELKLHEDEFHSIAFTGGEPLLHKDFLRQVLKVTATWGHKHYLETNGSLPAELDSVIRYLDIISMDFKLPSSTGGEDLWDIHREFLSIASRKEVFLKTIICQGTEQKDFRRLLRLILKIDPTLILVLQPNSYDDAEALHRKMEEFKDMAFREQIATCIIPQMHKLIGLR